MNSLTHTHTLWVYLLVHPHTNHCCISFVIKWQINYVPKFPRNLHMNQDVSTLHMSETDPVYNSTCICFMTMKRILTLKLISESNQSSCTVQTMGRTFFLYTYDLIEYDLNTDSKQVSSVARIQNFTFSLARLSKLFFTYEV